MNPKRNKVRHILIKLTKIKYKEKILKETKQQITYIITPIRITANLSEEIQQARREWQDIFKVMKGRNLKPRIHTQQASHSDLKERSKDFQTNKS